MKRLYRSFKIFTEIIFSFVLMLACLFGGLLFYQDSNVKLEDVNWYTGVIRATKVISKTSTVAGSARLGQRVFAFKVIGLDQKLAIFNPKQDYERYENNMHIGDTISVYFQYKNSDELNTDVYQIEKGKRIVMDVSEYTKRNRVGACIAFIGAIALAILWVMRAKKLLSKEKIINDRADNVIS